MSRNEPPPPRTATLGVRVAVLAASVVGLWLWATAMWAAWLSWDRVHFRMDGVRYSVPPGVYSSWQLIGCGGSVVVGSIVALAMVRTVFTTNRASNRTPIVMLLAGAAASGAVVPWTLDVAHDPTSDGLFLMASTMLMVFGGGGLAVLLVIADVVAGTRPSDGP